MHRQMFMINSDAIFCFSAGDNIREYLIRGIKSRDFQSCANILQTLAFWIQSIDWRIPIFWYYLIKHFKLSLRDRSLSSLTLMYCNYGWARHVRRTWGLWPRCIKLYYAGIIARTRTSEVGCYGRVGCNLFTYLVLVNCVYATHGPVTLSLINTYASLSCCRVLIGV